MKNSYELMVILKPLLPEDIKAGIEKRLGQLVKKLGGAVTSTDVWGKRHLAYKIEGHEEGYYIVYKFEMPGESMDEFNTEIKHFNDILRFLVVREENV